MTNDNLPGIELNHARGPWMTVASGRRFYPFDPQIEDVTLDDIAHHLAHSARYNGATSRFYSVAEHSILCAEYALVEYEDYDLALQALLHDAAEAYIGDLVKPVKVRLPQFTEIEDKIMDKAICPRFGLDWPLDERIHDIDMILCATEKRDLLIGSEPWPNMPQPWDEVSLLNDVSPYVAKRGFIAQFALIWNGLVQ